MLSAARRMNAQSNTSRPNPVPGAPHRTAVLSATNANGLVSRQPGISLFKKFSHEGAGNANLPALKTPDGALIKLYQSPWYQNRFEVSGKCLMPKGFTPEQLTAAIRFLGNITPTHYSDFSSLCYRLSGPAEQFSCGLDVGQELLRRSQNDWRVLEEVLGTIKTGVPQDTTPSAFYDIWEVVAGLSPQKRAQLMTVCQHLYRRPGPHTDYALSVQLLASMPLNELVAVLPIAKQLFKKAESETQDKATPILTPFQEALWLTGLVAVRQSGDIDAFVAACRAPEVNGDHLQQLFQRLAEKPSSAWVKEAQMCASPPAEDFILVSDEDASSAPVPNTSATKKSFFSFLGL